MNTVSEAIEFAKKQHQSECHINRLPRFNMYRVQVIKHIESGKFTIRKGNSGYTPGMIRSYVKSTKWGVDLGGLGKYINPYSQFATIEIAASSDEDAFDKCHTLAEVFQRDENFTLNRGSSFFFKVLPEPLLEIIDGCVAGDGSIMMPKGSSAFFLYQISSKYKQHIESLRKDLAEYGFSGEIRQYSGTKDGKRQYFEALTWFLKAFNPHRDRWYRDGIKKLPDDVRNTPTFWKWLYAGDGSIAKTGEWSRQVSIATNCYSTEDVDRLLDMLKQHGISGTKYNVLARTPSVRPKWAIFIFGQHALNFLYMTFPGVEGLEYKWDIPALPIKFCPVCKGLFRPNVTTRVYCGKACQRKHRRQAEAEAAASALV